MGCNSEQMKAENIIDKGVRGDVIVLKEKMPNYTWLDVIRNDPRALMQILDNSATWEDFVRGCRSTQLYGNTKFIDTGMLPALFKNDMRIGEAARDIGYAVTYGKTGNNTGAKAYVNRLRRLNINSPFILIEPFIKKGFITREKVANAINRRVANSVKRGKYYLFYTWFYVTSAYSYFEEDLAVTAGHLKVTQEAVMYWVERTDIKDPRVKR